MHEEIVWTIDFAILPFEWLMRECSVMNIFSSKLLTGEHIIRIANETIFNHISRNTNSGKSLKKKSCFVTYTIFPQRKLFHPKATSNLFREHRVQWMFWFYWNDKRATTSEEMFDENCEKRWNNTELATRRNKRKNRNVNSRRSYAEYIWQQQKICQNKKIYQTLLICGVMIGIVCCWCCCYSMGRLVCLWRIQLKQCENKNANFCQANNADYKGNQTYMQCIRLFSPYVMVLKIDIFGWLNNPKTVCSIGSIILHRLSGRKVQRIQRNWAFMLPYHFHTHTLNIL